MNGADYEAAKEHLIAAAKLIGDENRQTHYRLVFKQTEANWFAAADAYMPTARRSVIVAMVGCLYDGVAYGNWPAARGEHY